MSRFYAWRGEKKSRRIKPAVMDMRNPFRKATLAAAPGVAIVFDKFHVLCHLGEALDQVRKAGYARLSGEDRRFIKGQKYTPLSNRDLTLEGRKALKALLVANKWLNTAYVLKESFDQVWSCQREGWARRFFDPSDPTACVRPTRRGVSAPKDPHLACCRPSEIIKDYPLVFLKTLYSKGIGGILRPPKGGPSSRCRECAELRAGAAWATGNVYPHLLLPGRGKWKLAAARTAGNLLPGPSP